MAGSESDIPQSQSAAYLGLLENARAMLLAAREERWDDLIDLTAERAVCLAEVMKADQVTTGPEDISAQAEMMHSILDCDKQTGALSNVRQTELAGMLGSMDNERRLAGAYRSS